MADTPLFPVEGTDIKLFEVAKWDRRTIADGRWLNDNNIEPLIDNDIILAKSIQKYGNYDVKIESPGETISVREEIDEQTRTKSFKIDVSAERDLAYLNSNRGKNDSQLTLSLSDGNEHAIALGSAEKIVGSRELEFSDDKKSITRLVNGKKYILSAELFANVTSASDRVHTVSIKTRTGIDQWDDFDFHVDCTQVHTVSKSITWMAEEPDGDSTGFDISMTLRADSIDGVPGVSFSVGNIFCLEHAGGGNGDGNGPVYWIGRSGPEDQFTENVEKSLRIPASPDFGGRSIRTASDTSISFNAGVYQITALIDLKLNDTIDTLSDLEVDFGDGFVKCSGVTHRIEESKYYTVNYSFVKHVSTDDTVMVVKVKCPSSGTARVKYLSIAKFNGSSSGSSDPGEIQWIRAASETAVSLRLPTDAAAVYGTTAVQNLRRSAGTLSVENGSVKLTDDRLYQFNASIEATNVGGSEYPVNTVADIVITVKGTGNDTASHKFSGTLQLDETRTVTIPVSGVIRGPGSISIECYGRLKEEDSSLPARSVNFEFLLTCIEVVEK